MECDIRTKSRRKPTHAAIPPLGVGVSLDNTGIALLKILLPGWLNCHLVLGSETDSSGARYALRGLGAAAVDNGRCGRHGGCCMYKAMAHVSSFIDKKAMYRWIAILLNVNG